jgi:DNA-binding beta-propeller fold protein YncE
VVARLRPALITALTLVVLAGCGADSAAGPAVYSLSGRAAFVPVPGPPFGVVATPDGRYSLVDLIGGRVLVFSDASFVPKLIHTIRLPGVSVGSSLTRDGRYLLIANRAGATVVSVKRAVAGTPGAVLGTLAPNSRQQLGGAIETASSADGRYVFVSLEGSASVAVYDIGGGVAHARYIGLIPVGEAPVGLALSPDGRYLYTTSEVAGRQRFRGPVGTNGTLSVISVRAAERDPTHAVLATVPAMNQPVRVAVSPDGAVVWVTARGSDRLLAFSATKLLKDASHALLAKVPVGAAPVGLALFDHGKRVIVADSNRFNAPGQHAALTVVDTAAALAHRSSVIATIPSGMFPREMAVEPNGRTVLVGNFASSQLEVVDVRGL